MLTIIERINVFKMILLFLYFASRFFVSPFSSTFYFYFHDYVLYLLYFSHAGSTQTIRGAKQKTEARTGEIGSAKERDGGGAKPRATEDGAGAKPDCDATTATTRSFDERESYPATETELALNARERTYGEGMNVRREGERGEERRGEEKRGEEMRWECRQTERDGRGGRGKEIEGKRWEGRERNGRGGGGKEMGGDVEGKRWEGKGEETKQDE